MSSAEHMQSERVALVLADISGYTRFVHLHRYSQTHAEVIISELLEEVIGATETPLELHQLLGDAAVFFARSDESSEMARAVFAQMRRAVDRFRARAGEITGECTLCACGACRGAGQLRLKVVIHHGDAVVTSQRGFVKLAGEDVIVAHRLLKNTITSDEYVLVTEPFQQLLAGMPGPEPELRRESCDGVGEIGVAVYYPESAPEPVSVPLTHRVRRAVIMDAHTVKRLIGRRPMGGVGAAVQPRDDTEAGGVASGAAGSAPVDRSSA